MVFIDRIALLSVAIACLSLAGCGTTSSKSEKRKRSTESPATQSTPARTTTEATPKRATPETPAAPATTASPEVSEAYKRALASMQGNDNAAAESSLRAVLQAQPGFAEARVNLGIVLFRSGRYDPAEEEFKRVVTNDPRNAVAFNYLGILYRVKGQFPEAKGAYERAIMADQSYALAYLNLGILYDLYLRDLNRALSSYQRYQQLSPQEDKEVTKWIADLKRRVESGK